MAKSKFQKLKLLYIKELFEKSTDSEHGITVADIIRYLDENGIEAERKSIYDDIELLCDVWGMNIEKIKVPKTMEYRLMSRDFDIHELKLLGDAVGASRFITEKKSSELIGKLIAQCSRHDADKLSRQVLVPGRIKNMNESIFYNVDAIFDAIARERAITFRYFNRTFKSKTEREYRHGGERYEASPCALTYSEEKYYLVAYDFGSDSIRHYRVDRMEDIEISDRGREAGRYFPDMELGTYTDRHFGMFGGELKKVGVEFDSSLADAVYDRFGSDITAIDAGEGKYKVYVSVNVSEQFFGWVTGLGERARIISPPDVCDAYRLHLRRCLDMYGER